MQTTQIVALYENEGLTPEQIQMAMPELEKEAIVLALTNSSTKFRKQLKKTPNLFGDETMEMAKMVMADLLMAENEGVKYKAASFIINENLGRNALASNIKDCNIFANVNIFNEQLQRALAAKDKAIKQIIDVEEVKAA